MTSVHGLRERPYQEISMDSILSMGERNANILKIASKQIDVAKILQQHPYEIPKPISGLNMETSTVPWGITDFC